MKNKRNKKVPKQKPYITGNQSINQIKRSHFDPNGSWTGVPTDPTCMDPEQDADDL